MSRLTGLYSLSRICLTFIVSASLIANAQADDASTRSLDEAIQLESNESSAISEMWRGNYEGAFLRLPSESSDPRSWASVELKLGSNPVMFHYFSYPEQEINHNLEFMEEESESLLLTDESDEKYHIYKQGNKVLLESSFINKLMGRPEIIELNRFQ
ncbi:hypothetical protein [Saccharospirillum mangrovi]|uniref:hypothetical protein n=1 Tax=Saccharospirillum mangrovi TaxID=2161747 RepID=UPI000D3BB6B7|nr:hypothetical protein [Saccharospirillum mangrovi]